MPNEGFLQRWSRLKAAPEAAELPPAPAELPAHATHAAHTLPAIAAPRAGAPAAGTPAAETATGTGTETAAPLPTLADAAMLNADSDYSAFVARGVDADVRRLAMKKLFADPHFNLIDGLDIYMADYNLPSPVSPAMLASLSHARSVFGRIDELLDPDAAAQAAPSMTPPAPATDTTDTPDTTDITDTPAPTPQVAPPPHQEAP
jgi:hypothetical protein